MKKFLILLYFPFLFMCGCQDKDVSYSTIYRDTFNTGGDISFSYDNITHTASFGGENEVVQYYEIDISKGWNEAGNRIGLRLVAPLKISNPLSAKAMINSVEYNNGSFYRIINGEISSVAEFYPIVSEQNKELELKIIWQSGIKEQVYKIYILDGTIFL